MVNTVEPRPVVSDECVVHGLLAVIGLARVVGAVLCHEAWGAGPTLGLLLTLLAGRQLVRR